MFKVLFDFIQTFIQDINSFLLKFPSKKKFFEKICLNFVENLKIDLVFIGKFNQALETLENSELYAKCKRSDLLNFIDLEALYKEIIQKKKPLISQALSTGKIIFERIENKEFDVFIKPEKSNAEYLTLIPLYETTDSRLLIFLIFRDPLFEEKILFLMFEEIKKVIENNLELIKEIYSPFLFFRTLENSDTWIMIFNKSGKILYVNEVVCKVTGYSKDEFLGKRPFFLFPELQSKKARESFHKTLLQEKEFKKIFLARKKDGTSFMLELKIYPVKVNDETVGYVSIGKDLTYELLTSFELEKLKYYDPVTHLVNFKGFFFRAQRRLEPECLASLIIVDLWDFSYINRMFGILKGDEILRILAERLKNTLEETDIIGRLAGDTFGIFLPYLESPYEIFKVLQKIKEVFEIPFIIEKETVKINFNCGVSLYPLDAENFEELYEKASLALSYSKKKGPNEIVFYTKVIEKEKQSYFSVTKLIEDALKNDLFIFHFQPYFAISDLRIIGVEALVRIKGLDGKLYYPKDFIEILENSIYLMDFENWAIEELVQKSLFFEIPISFNLNPKTLKNEQIIEKLISAVCKCRARLWIELTERAFAEEYFKILKLIKALKNCTQEVKFLIDDFGTGYSSLNYLKDLPVDVIKIDKTFIQGMVSNFKDRSLVKTLIRLCKELEIASLAEGVETNEQLELLKEWGCDYVQGFFLCKPLPEDQLITMLKGRHQT